MKRILLLSSIAIALSGSAQTNIDTCKITMSDIHFYNLYILKTNGTGAPALYVTNKGVMTVNDSLESIKQLIKMVIKKDSIINNLHVKLRLANYYMNSLNGANISDLNVHEVFKTKNSYCKIMGYYEDITPCQCDKCLLKHPKNYRKDLHTNNSR